LGRTALGFVRGGIWKQLWEPLP